ncbi:MAG: hypothetical protein ACERKZ_04530 [Lachnotalea sp.]
MGLLELIGEAIRPGKIGTVDVTKGKKEKPGGMLIVKTIVSITIVAGLYYLLLGTSFHLKDSLFFMAIMAAYCIFSYFVLPKPDYSNLGWLGGAMDNPFRISDDINRFMLFLMIILIPGRLISTTVVSWVHILKR